MSLEVDSEDLKLMSFPDYSLFSSPFLPSLSLRHSIVRRQNKNKNKNKNLQEDSLSLMLSYTTEQQ